MRLPSVHPQATWIDHSWWWVEQQIVTPQARAKKHDAVRAEMKSHQPYRKRSSMSRWQGKETGKRVDLLGLHDLAA